MFVSTPGSTSTSGPRELGKTIDITQLFSAMVYLAGPVVLEEFKKYSQLYWSTCSPPDFAPIPLKIRPLNNLFLGFTKSAEMTSPVEYTISLFSNYFISFYSSKVYTFSSSNVFLYQNNDFYEIRVKLGY